MNANLIASLAEFVQMPLRTSGFYATRTPREFA